MSLILNIDSAIGIASICLAKDDQFLELTINPNQKDHAGWLHTSINEILKKNNFTVNDLNAVAVSIGPGSYTGLRVGLASAKGFCYALNIPIITIGTLEMMAFGVKDEVADADLICPMIDARRMEVFTAVYDKALVEKISPHALLIKETSFSALLSSNKILFCGDGSKKIQSTLSTSNARFSDTITNASHLALLAYNRFLKKEFANLAYAEPIYVKEFYTLSTRVN